MVGGDNPPTIRSGGSKLTLGRRTDTHNEAKPTFSENGVLTLSGCYFLDRSFFFSKNKILTLIKF